MPRFRRAIKRRPDGDLDIRLGDQERALLESLASEVRSLIDADQDGDPKLVRLFPPTYADDPAREAAFQTLMGDDLRASHLAALEQLSGTAREVRIDEERAFAWMQAINSVRLVLGTHLDVDESPVRPSPRDPAAGLYAAYEYLGGLLWELVDALGS